MKKKIIIAVVSTISLVQIVINQSNNEKEEVVLDKKIQYENKKVNKNNDNNKIDTVKKNYNNKRNIKYNLEKNYKDTNHAKNKENKVESYMVYFDNNGGDNNVKSKQVIYNKEYGLLPNPSKEGYTFTGWYTKKNSGEKINSDTKMSIKSNHYLYAHYDINNYYITYDYNFFKNNLYKNSTSKELWSSDFKILNDDELFNNENVFEFDLKENILRYKEKINIEKGKSYTFSVYIKSDEEKDISIGFENNLINVRINSNWNRFTKTFNLEENEDFILKFDGVNDSKKIKIYGLMLTEGNLNTNIDSKKYNEKIGEIEKPIRDGYIFDGWYKNVSFIDKVIDDEIIYSDETYYAKWKPIIYNLKIDPNGGYFEGDTKIKKYSNGYNTIKYIADATSNYKVTYFNSKEVIVNRKFKGWYDENNNLLENKFVFNKNANIKAIYDNTINIKLESINKENYTCNWNTKKDGSGNSYSGNSIISISDNLILYPYCTYNVKFERPINNGYITSEYGNRIHPVTKQSKFHSGIDMASNDRNIYSILPGTVAKTGKNSSMGNYIIIYHEYNNEKYTSAYYHLEEKYVRKGEKIDQSKVIGKMGQTGLATGVHLHLTMYKGYLYDGSSKMINPRDYIYFQNRWQNKRY